MSLPELVRFKELQAAGIVDSWPQLKNMQEKYGFPLGKLLGASLRAWDVLEIKQWLAQRPTETFSPQVIKRLEKATLARQQRRLRDQQTTTGTGKCGRPRKAEQQIADGEQVA
jgi:hypothetical protein